MSKVSVIIPVYNVEEYLPKCLDSVINQTLKDIEIICVNDCSPDNSFAILEDYAQKDNRIKIINREQNGGLSAARNSGLAIAQGEYIYFLDSDDWIDLDYVEKMYNAAVKSGVDIVVNDNVLSEKEESSIPYIHGGTKNIPNGTLLDAKENIVDIICSGCFKLYKKSFLDKHNFSFPEGYINEDLYFHFITFPFTENIYFIKESNYHYLDRPTSIMNTKRDKDYEILKIYNLIYDYYLENNLLKHKIKIFSVMPHFNINSEEKFNLFKEYFTKVKQYLIDKKDVFNELDIFFMNNIISTENYEEYKSKFSPSVTMSFIRRKK